MLIISGDDLTLLPVEGKGLLEPLSRPSSLSCPGGPHLQCECLRGEAVFMTVLEEALGSEEQLE